MRIDRALTRKIEDALFLAVKLQHESVALLQASNCIEFNTVDGDSRFLWQSLYPSRDRGQTRWIEKQEPLEEPEYYLASLLAQLFQKSNQKGLHAESLVVENQSQPHVFRFCISGSISLDVLQNLYESVEEPDNLHEKR